jgi:hypothetical protein
MTYDKMEINYDDKGSPSWPRCRNYVYLLLICLFFWVVFFVFEINSSLISFSSSSRWNQTIQVLRDDTAASKPALVNHLIVEGVLTGGLFLDKCAEEKEMLQQPSRRIFSSYEAAANFSKMSNNLSPLLGAIIQEDHNNSTQFYSLPSFLIIGVQKAGTTFYRNILNTHPILLALNDPNREVRIGDETVFVVTVVVTVTGMNPRAN